MHKLGFVGFLVGATTILSACATPSTKLQNASGQVVDCSSSGWGVVGTPLALASHSDCVNRMQAAGYRVVNEGSIAPKPSADAAKIDIHLPEGWERKPLTETMAKGGGSVYAINKTGEAGVLVSVVNRKGIADLMAYVMSRRADQESKLLNPQSTEITLLNIDGRQAFRFEVAGYLKGGLKGTYLQTIIEGANHLAVVNAWAKSIDYPQYKGLLESLASKLTGIDQSIVASTNVDEMAQGSDSKPSIVQKEKWVATIARKNRCEGDVQVDIKSQDGIREIYEAKCTNKTIEVACEFIGPVEVETNGGPMNGVPFVRVAGKSYQTQAACWRQ